MQVQVLPAVLNDNMPKHTKEEQIAIFIYLMLFLIALGVILGENYGF